MDIDHDIYSCDPIAWSNGIPVFSKTGFYVENYDKISQDHLEHFEQTGANPFIGEDYWREVEGSTRELVGKYAADGCRVLDVGVGMGRLLGEFPGLKRHGMDISLGYLRHSKGKGIDVCMAMIEDMPFKPEVFDVVVSTDVLEHVFDLNLALRNILSTLKPGGYLIGRVPYREDLAGYLRPEVPYELVHLRNFDEFSLRLLFERVLNLQMVEYSFTGFTDGNPKLRLPSDRLYRWLRSTISASKRLGKNWHQKITRACNRPDEINFVVKNVPSDPGRTL